ncbi:protein kinase [Planomonospora corallina]|uniref:non-specific serine/threonine protein kinase n=1 Tax=Planomonospora corallina TaxID=1806052 RepID=A0ABV8IBM5_9ACTN
MTERKVAGRYQLLEPIGEGGMGVVWRAHDELLDRVVAVKEVRYRGIDETARADLNQRTVREAKTAGRLDHPSVIIVHDVVEEDGRPWIVMQLVRSRSLGEVVRERGPLAPARAAAVGLSVLGALRAAHAAGVLHRDVKPENVLLADDGRVVLTDFGIAANSHDTGITRTGGMVGTPAFLPPERLHGLPATPESDLWSLGATLYAAVEGRPPFQRDTAAATMMAVLSGEPAPLTCSGPLAAVITGLMVKDPAARMGAGEAEALLTLAAGGQTVPEGAPPPPPPSAEAPYPASLAAPSAPAAGTRPSRGGTGGRSSADRPSRTDRSSGRTDRPSRTDRSSGRTGPSPRSGGVAPPGPAPAYGGPPGPAHPAAPGAYRDVPGAPQSSPGVSPGAFPGQASEPSRSARPGAPSPATPGDPFAATPFPATPGDPFAATPRPAAGPAGHAPVPYPGGPAHPAPAAFPAHPGGPAGTAGTGRRSRREHPTLAGSPASSWPSARKLALAVGAPVLAVAVGVGGWLVLRDGGTSAAADRPAGDAGPATAPPTAPSSGTGRTPGASPAPDSTAPDSTAGSGTGRLPKGWRWYEDPEMGFTVAIPRKWTARRATDRNRVEFRAPGAASFLWIESTEDPEVDPVKHWEKVEKVISVHRQSYRRIGITPLSYRGLAAADWEFTYTSGGVPMHVLDRGFRTADGTPYAIYWESPEDRWDRAYFDRFTDTFRP